MFNEVRRIVSIARLVQLAIIISVISVNLSSVNW